MGFVSVVFCNVSFFPSVGPLAISANILPLHANSLQARILEQPSCYAGYCSHGRQFTRKTGYQSPIGYSGPRYTAWRSASTTALLVRHLAPRWLVSYGGIFLGESIFISEPATLRASMFLLLRSPWQWDALSLLARFILSGTRIRTTHHEQPCNV